MGGAFAGALPHAYLFELPGLGHGQTPPGCFDAIVVSFLKDPTRAPDAGCIAGMPRLAFETGRLERPVLFFTITSAGGPASPFTGTWDAGFPNAPRPFTFALTVSNQVVTGKITAGGGALTLDIFDGTVDDRRIIFKVKSPEGGRTITFSGTIDGDRIAFTRDVDVPPGTDPGGAALWGASGARTFIARRMQ